MLTTNQTSRLAAETAVAVVEEVIPRRSSVGRYAREVAPFLAAVVQFGLIVRVVRDWQLESLSVSRLMDLAFVGFVIHHLLPLRFRLSFFAVLSLIAVVLGVGEMGTR